MKVSSNNPAGKQYRVFLDDVECSGVISADEEVGTLVQYKKNDFGHYILQIDGSLEEETLFGIVRIEEIDAAPLSPDAARIAAKRALRQFH